VSEDALVLQRELVNAPYSELELDAGHFVMQDQPDAVVAAVLAHIDSPASTPWP
jgi:pimeloyl-ACP methyl ester carboxylesterase